MEMRFLWNLSRCPGAGFLKSTEKLWHHERKFRFSTFLFKNTNFFDKFPAARNPNKRWVGLICIYLIKKQTNQKKTRSFPTARVPWVFGSPVIKWTRKLPQADVSVTSTGQKIHFPQDLKLFLGTQTEHNTKVCWFGCVMRLQWCTGWGCESNRREPFSSAIETMAIPPPHNLTASAHDFTSTGRNEKGLFFSLFFTPWNWQKIRINKST